MSIPEEDQTELWGVLKNLGLTPNHLTAIKKLSKEFEKLGRERQGLSDNLEDAQGKVTELKSSVVEAALSVNTNLELVENKKTLLMQAAARKSADYLRQLEGVSREVKELTENLSANDELHVFQTRDNITQAHSQLQTSLDAYLYERAIFCNDKENKVNVFEPLIGKYAWPNNLTSTRNVLAAGLIKSYNQIIHNDERMTWLYDIVFKRLKNYIQRITRKEKAPYSRREQLIKDLHQLKMLFRVEQTSSDVVGVALSQMESDPAFLQTGSKDQKKHIVGLIRLLSESRRLTEERQIELADKYIYSKTGLMPKGSRFWQEMHSRARVYFDVDDRKYKELKRKSTLHDESVWFSHATVEIPSEHLELQNKLQKMMPLGRQESQLLQIILGRLVESQIIDTTLVKKIELVLFSQEISVEQYLNHFPEVFNTGSNPFKPRRNNVLKHQGGLKKIEECNERHDLESIIQQVKKLASQSIVSESCLSRRYVRVEPTLKMSSQQKQLDKLRQTEMQLQRQYDSLREDDKVTSNDFYNRCVLKKPDCSDFLKKELRVELTAVNTANKSLEKAGKDLKEKKKKVTIATKKVEKAKDKLTEHDEKQAEAKQKLDKVKRALRSAIVQYKKGCGSFSSHGNKGLTRAENLLASVNGAKDLSELRKNVELAKKEHIEGHWLGKSCVHWILFREGSLLTFVSAAIVHVLKNYDNSGGTRPDRLGGATAPEHYDYILKRFNQSARQSCGLFSTSSYQRSKNCNRLLAVVANAARAA